MQEDSSLNLLEFLAIIKRRKAIFYLVCAPAVTIAIFASVLMTKVYRASAVISYSTIQESTDFSSLEGLSKVLSPFDISLSTGLGEIIKLLQSRNIAEEVIKNKDLLKVFFEERKTFLSFIMSKPPVSSMWDGIRFIQGHLSVDYDKLSKTIEISFDFRDPQMAVEIVTEYIDVLNKRIKMDTISTAQNVIKALEKELNKVEDINLKENIYRMIASQIQKITFAESQKYLNFKVLDPPKVPDKKIKPKRRLIIIVTFFGSMMISLFLVLLLEHIERLKAGQTPRQTDEDQ